VGQREKCKSRGLYFFLRGRKGKSLIGNRIFVRHRIVLAVKKLEFVSDRMLYIVLRGRWYNIIVLNVHVSSEEKSNDSKDRFYEGIRTGFLSFS